MTTSKEASMRKFIKRPKSSTPDTGPIVVTVTGGLPAGDPDAVEAAQQVRRQVADGRRVVVHGGLPDTLPGEQWTPEQRKAHDDEHYGRAHGHIKQNPMGE
jgi:hypothetical protein